MQGEPAAQAAVERIVESFQESERAPAVSAAVLARGKVIVAAARGWADAENEVAAVPETVFRLGSLSKPLTAVTALMLAEQGALDLDAPVEKCVSQWQGKAWPVTVRQLLGHLGGVRNVRDDNSDSVSTVHYWSLGESLQAFAADPLAHEPGTRYLYSRYGYCLAGAAIEAAAGMSYAEAVASLVLRRTSMDSTRVDDVYAIIPNRARGYRRSPTGELQNCPLSDLSILLPSGGWLATAADVARFIQALLQGSLLTNPSLEMMLERQRLKDGSRTGYGLGVGINRDRAPRVFGHAGGVAGASSYLAFSPDTGAAAVTLANMEGLNLRPMAEAMLDEGSR